MLRETVAIASSCLDDLSPAQRRVLTLRAGVGAGPPRSRGGVARRLNITVRRVARLERSGLKRLRTLARAGSCAAPAARTFAPASVAAPAASTGDAVQPSGAAERGGGNGARSGSDNGGSGGGSDGGTGGVDAPRNGGVAGVTQTSRPGGLDLTIPFILLVLAVGATLIARTLRRELAPARVAEAPDEPQPRPAWIPWRRSTLDGPSWTASPPPSSERAGEWASAPDTKPDPEPEPHDEWTPPSRRSRSDISR